MSRRSIAILALAGSASLAHAATTATTYTVQELPGTDEGRPCEVDASGISPTSGLVVGNSCARSGTHDFGTVWNNGRQRRLHSPSSGTVQANSVNDAGDAAGDVFDSQLQSSAVRWTANGDIRQLPLLTPGDHSGAYGIGASGDIVGFETSGLGASPVPILWHRDVPAVIALPPGQGGGGPTCISPSGMMAGSSTDAEGVARAVLWSNGSPAFVGPVDATGLGVNDSGQVVGYSIQHRTFHIPFVATATSTTTLPLLPDSGSGSAVAISSDGVIVGQSTLNSSSPTISSRAVRWIDGQVVDLNTLLDAASTAAGWVIEFTTAIDGAGDIIATGQLKGGSSTTVVLVPSGS